MCAKVVPVVQHKFYPTFKNIHFKYWTLKQHVVSTSGALPPVTRNFCGCRAVGQLDRSWSTLFFKILNVKFGWWQPRLLKLCFWYHALINVTLINATLFALFGSLDCVGLYKSILTDHMFRLFFDGKCSLVIEIHDVAVQITILV